MTTDAEQFTTLYRRHYAEVERYVRRRTDDAGTRDVVAEVFLVVWRRRDVLPSNVVPWLYGVARHVLANEVRGVRRARSLVERIGRHGAGEVVADHADGVADRRSLAAAFDGLSEADREVLRLVVWEGLELPEAARAAECSGPTFRMRLFRARRRLLAALDTESDRSGSSVVEPAWRTADAQRGYRG